MCLSRLSPPLCFSPYSLSDCLYSIAIGNESCRSYFPEITCQLPSHYIVLAPISTVFPPGKTIPNIFLHLG